MQDSGPITTATSAASGRLKVDAGKYSPSKKGFLKKILKDGKGGCGKKKKDGKGGSTSFSAPTIGGNNPTYLGRTGTLGGTNPALLPQGISSSQTPAPAPTTTYPSAGQTMTSKPKSVQSSSRGGKSMTGVKKSGKTGISLGTKNKYSSILKRLI